MQPAVQSRYLGAAVPAPGPDDRSWVILCSRDADLQLRRTQIVAGVRGRLPRAWPHRRCSKQTQYGDAENEGNGAICEAHRREHAHRYWDFIEATFPNEWPHWKFFDSCKAARHLMDSVPQKTVA